MRGLEAKHIVQPTLNTEDPCWKWQKRFKDICQIVWSMVCLSDIAGGGQPLNEKPDTVAADVHIGRTIPHYSTFFHTFPHSASIIQCPHQPLHCVCCIIQTGAVEAQTWTITLTHFAKSPFFIHDHDPKRPGLGTKTHNCFNWNFSSPSQICELNSLELGQKSPNW